jgi:hypothetical protein
MIGCKWVKNSTTEQHSSPKLLQSLANLRLRWSRYSHRAGDCRQQNSRGYYSPLSSHGITSFRDCCYYLWPPYRCWIWLTSICLTRALLGVLFLPFMMWNDARGLNEEPACRKTRQTSLQSIILKDVMTSLWSLLTSNRRKICVQFSTGF